MAYEGSCGGAFFKKTMTTNIINIEQNTNAWHIARLGKITASQIAKLIGKGRGKEEVFTQTGKSYLMQIVAGRMVSPDVINDTEALDAFVYRISTDNYATRWGHDNEDEARQWYAMMTGNKVDDGKMFAHVDYPTLTASPDGLVGDDGLIEIKCPYTIEKSVTYMLNINDAESLKAVAPDYYWQVMCQLAVTGRKWCDFVVYDKNLSNVATITRIDRNEDDIKQMLERVTLAEEMVARMVARLTPSF